VLHRFDTDDAHTGSDVWFAGTSEDERASIDNARAHLTGWLDALPGRAFGDIAIRLFLMGSASAALGRVMAHCRLWCVRHLWHSAECAVG
jgi:hypothetical protein